MRVPRTNKNETLLHQVEAIRIKPGEVLLLRFTHQYSIEDIQQFDDGIYAGPLRHRVVCIRVPEDVEAFVVEAPK